MSIEFAPWPIRYVSADALFVAFEQSPIQAGGEPAPSKFWDHAAGGFGSGPLVPARHVRPLARVAPAGSVNSAFQGFGVPCGVAYASAVHALLYKLGPDGAYVEWGRVEGPSLAYLSGAN